MNCSSLVPTVSLALVKAVKSTGLPLPENMRAQPLSLLFLDCMVAGKSLQVAALTLMNRCVAEPGPNV